MIRESLEAGAAQATMLVSPGKGLAFQRRIAAGGLSTNTAGGSGAAPSWVRLTRVGQVITAARSSDGVTWTTVGHDTFSMPGAVYVGLAVASHDTVRTASAAFSGLRVRALP